MSQRTNEIMLAEEQGVVNKMGSKEVEGTLVLTDQRLLFVAGQEQEPSRRFIFSDVYELSSVTANPLNLSIPLQSITSTGGHKGGIGLPNLKLNWTEESGENKNTEFIQRVISRSRKKNLNDWAQIIYELKTGKRKITSRPQPPTKDALEGKILYVLEDMQEKGEFEIEDKVEHEFGVDLDPDLVEEACEKLVSQGLVDKMQDSSGDAFYRKRSPLGEDDLSS